MIKNPYQYSIPFENNPDNTPDSDIKRFAAISGSNTEIFKISVQKYTDFILKSFEGYPNNTTEPINTISNTSKTNTNKKEVKNYQFSHQQFSSYKITIREDGTIESLRVHFGKNYNFEVYIGRYTLAYNSSTRKTYFDVSNLKTANMIQGSGWDRQVHHINYFQNSGLKIDILRSFVQKLLEEYHREKLA